MIKKLRKDEGLQHYISRRLQTFQYLSDPDVKSEYPKEALFTTLRAINRACHALERRGQSASEFRRMIPEVIKHNE